MHHVKPGIATPDLAVRVPHALALTTTMLEPTDKTFQQHFYSQFQASRSSSYPVRSYLFSPLSRVDSGLADRLEASKNNTTSDNDWQQLALDIRKLRKSLTDATSFLAAYDQRQCQAVRSPNIISLTRV